MLLRLGAVTAALSLAVVAALLTASFLHSEPGAPGAVEQARSPEPETVERPAAIAKGFQKPERPNIRPEPAVAPETRNLKRKIAQQQKAEQQRSQRQAAARRQAARQEAARQEAERQEAERQEAEHQKAERERQRIERQKAEAEQKKAAAAERVPQRVRSLPAGVSREERSRPPSDRGAAGEDRPTSRGGKMALSIKSIGLRNSKIETSEEQRVLDRGLMHLPQTSRPWERGESRNVYVVGHRMGWPDTGSWKIFYRLDELRRGDELVLTAGDKTHRYEVSKKLVVSPRDVWVTERVKGRDMLTLQTCTGPNFSERLIIRADRV